MSIIADRLDNMDITVSSPDGNIDGRYRRRGELTLEFRGNAYERYRQHTLEHQLARLATLLWTGYQREYDTAVSEVVGHPVKDERHLWDANRRRYREAQRETAASGMSAGGRVYVENTGMLTWHVVIRDGTLGELAAAEFASECVSAFGALMNDYRSKMAALRAEHYGVSFAPKRRERQPRH